MTEPRYRSMVFDDIPVPDFADVHVVPLPPAAPLDPARWAREVFSPGAMPGWVRAAIALRQAVVPLLGLRPSPRDTFAVQAVRGEEALLCADEAHLDFRAGLAVDPDARLVRLSTAVRLKGWRGRVYFLPVRLLHGVVVQAMLRRASRRLRGATPS